MEASAIPLLMVPIPGFPLSVGRTCLVLLGVVGIAHDRTYYASPFAKVLLLLLAGCFVGTFFSDEFFKDLVSLVGFALLLFGSYSSATLLRFSETRKILKVFFYFVFGYWCCLQLFFIIGVRWLVPY